MPVDAAPTASRTFGIEIECILGLAEASAAINAAGILCRIEHYGHATPLTWKVVTDGSVPDGCEVVSPVLSGEEGIAEVRIVMNALAAAGATINKTCGLHVHIGASDFTLDKFKKIAKNYIFFERFFDNIMPASRRADNNQYIRSNRNKFGGYDFTASLRAAEAIDACATIDEVIGTVNGSNPNVHRYFKLNMTAFWRHRTIEFRQHSGTVEADKAINWIRLLLQFVDRAHRTRIRGPRRQRTLGRVFRRFFVVFAISDDLKAFYIARRAQFHGDAAE